MAYRSADEANAIIERLERENELFSITIDGIAVWQLVRYTASVALQAIPIPPKPRNRFKGVFRLLTQAVKDCFFLLGKKRFNYLFFNDHSIQVRYPEGAYGDKNFSLIINTLRDVAYATSNPKSGALRPTLTPHVFSSALPLLHAMIMKRCRKRPAEVTRTARRLAEILTHHKELAFFDESLLTRAFHGFFLEKACWEWILKRLGDPLVAVADTGDYALAAAAAARGIAVAEFQHGIMAPSNPTLIPSDSAPPGRGIITRDALFLNGEYWKEMLSCRRWASIRRMEAAGSPWLETLRDLRRTLPEKEKNIILCTLQGIATEELLKFVRSAFEQVSDDDLKLVLKLHPLKTYERNAAEAAFAGVRGATILAGDEGLSTHELLARAKLHLSISSATHYDALAIGTPTCIMPFATHEIVNHLVELGVALFADDVAALAAVMAAEKTEQPAFLSERLCRPDSLERIRLELESLYRDSPCRKKN